MEAIEGAFDTKDFLLEAFTCTLLPKAPTVKSEDWVALIDSL